MKLLAISDLHIGKQGWGNFGDRTLALSEAKVMASYQPVDVVLFCGDLVDPDAAPTMQERLPILEDALRRLKRIQAREHLWVLGNNDLLNMMSPASPLSMVDFVLNMVGAKFGVHVLDREPKVVDNTAFVGNLGGFDGSLWRPPAMYSPNFPSTKEDMLRHLYPRELSIGADLSGVEYFERCQLRLHEHISQMEREHPSAKLVVATHTVPSPKMVVYGATPAYDHQNAWMGWDDDLSQRPIHKVSRLVLQLCGHTHRSGKIDRPGKAPLHNVSGQDQPLIFEV